MIYKLGRDAEKRRRRLRGVNHLTKVIEDVKFKDGIEVNEDKTVPTGGPPDQAVHQI